MKHLMHIFVAIAFLTGVIAPACGFSWGGKYSVIEICTSEGIESRIVDTSQNGQNNLPAHKAGDQCQFCFQSANVKDSFPPLTQIKKKIVSLERIQYAQYETIILNTQHTPQSLRGPPALI